MADGWGISRDQLIMKCRVLKGTDCKAHSLDSVELAALNSFGQKVTTALGAERLAGLLLAFARRPLPKKEERSQGGRLLKHWVSGP